MILVRKREPDDDAWKRLRDRCVAETRKVVARFSPAERVAVDEKLYQAYMPFLHRIFNDKCAYCETSLDGQPGDVEHFRPKGRVCDANFSPVEVEDQEWGRLPHPGYYWLMYDWDNLLPSCADCNRFRWHGKEVGAGKADRFPVKGRHACRPEHQASEEPLIIDPSKVDPQQHLHFTFDPLTRQFIFVADTPEAEATIDLFGLNKREKMVRRRTEAYAEAQVAFKAYIDESKAARYDDEWEQARLRVNGMWDGKTTFTAIRRFALRVAQLRYSRSHLNIPLPIPALLPEQ